jgi:hypothetical protein
MVEFTHKNEKYSVPHVIRNEKATEKLFKIEGYKSYGGFAQVFKAQDLKTLATVVVKIVSDF